MNNDDAIRMAREAGIHVYPEFEGAFKRFAELARADEREACAKVCEQSDRYRGEYFAALIRERGNK